MTNTRNNLRPKSRWELIRLSMAVMGIELAYAAETAFVSPTFLQIGVPKHLVTLLWGLSPLIGFFLTPILGSLSDQCTWRIGRRRPFILLTAIGVCLGLLLIPNGSQLGTYLGDYDTCYSNSSMSDVEPPNDPLENCSQKYWTILLTLIGTVLVDFSADSGQSPARTYLCDVTPKSDHARGMSTFSLMAGIGGCLGYLIGAIDWPQTMLGTMFGSQINAVFTIVLISFIVCVMYTITAFAEIPLERRIATPSTTAIATPARTTPSRSTPPRPSNASSPMPWMYFSWKIVIEDNIEMGNVSNQTPEPEPEPESNTVEPTAAVSTNRPSSAQTNTSSGGASSGVGFIRDDEFVVNTTPSPNDSEQSEFDEMPVPTLKTYLNSIVTMPSSLRILCLTNLFSWMSHVCYSLYFTDYVAQAVFGGDPNAEPNSLDEKLYNDGVRYGCWGLAIYSASCSIFALFIDRLIVKVGCKNVYVYSLLVYGVGMLFMFFLNDKVSVLIFSGTAGVMYATLFTLPYFLVTYYHQKNMFGRNRRTGNHQVRGLGTDMAVTHSMVFLAQFILSLGMGFAINLLGSTSAIVLVSSILSFCAAAAATKIFYLDL